MTRPGINIETFWSQVDKTGPGGCWIWTGCTSKPTATAGEYGKYAGRGVAHRVAYELTRGPIPTGRDEARRAARAIETRELRAS